VVVQLQQIFSMLNHHPVSGLFGHWRHPSWPGGAIRPNTSQQFANELEYSAELFRVRPTSGYVAPSGSKKGLQRLDRCNGIFLLSIDVREVQDRFTHIDAQLPRLMTRIRL
jgi:hypothetical protein